MPASGADSSGSHQARLSFHRREQAGLEGMLGDQPSSDKPIDQIIDIAEGARL